MTSSLAEAPPIGRDARRCVLAMYRSSRDMCTPLGAAATVQDAWARQIAQCAVEGVPVSPFTRDCYRAAAELTALVSARRSSQPWFSTARARLSTGRAA